MEREETTVDAATVDATSEVTEATVVALEPRERMELQLNVVIAQLDMIILLLKAKQD